MVAQPEDRPGITFKDGTHESELTPIDTVNRIIDEAFANVPEDERARARPAMIRWLNQKAGIEPDDATE